MLNNGFKYHQTCTTTEFAFKSNISGGHTAENQPYRFGYQGQEFEPITNTSSFMLRSYDARLGRWFSPDPMQEFHSPYLGMGNNPIRLIDPLGGQTEGLDPERNIALKNILVFTLNNYLHFNGEKYNSLQEVTIWGKKETSVLSNIDDFGEINNAISKMNNSTNQRTADDYYKSGVLFANGGNEAELLSRDRVKETDNLVNNILNPINTITSASSNLLTLSSFKYTMDNQWFGSNSKWYNINKFYGNQSVSGYKTAIRNGKLLRDASKKLFWVNAFLSTIDAIDAIQEEDFSRAKKDGADVVIGTIGIIGGSLGGVGAACYFVIDALDTRPPGPIFITPERYPADKLRVEPPRLNIILK